MRIGITGWKGFIGSHLKDRLDNPVLFQGNMRNLADVSDFVAQCDRIYHLAGKNRDQDGGILANNLVATGALVLATRLLKTNPDIIFASSRQVEWNPKSEYGMTKLVEENIIRNVAKWHILRIPNVYGPGGKPFYNSVVATFAYQIAHNQDVIMTKPLVTMEFIFIDDLIEVLLEPSLHRIISAPGEVMSIQEVHDYLTTRLGEHEKLKECLDYYDDLLPPRWPL